MKFSKLTWLLAILAFLLPVSAIGSGIDVQTGNVRASTNQDGSVYVRTGNTSVHVPPRPTYNRWSFWRFWERPSWNRGCRNQVYQKTTQTTRSGGRVVHSSNSTSSHSCR
ncbi:MAG: hypothetical protein QNJ34_25810 [Xenococcaceae cyanobacterium MO_188.B29]|nr:hypothetical protein [Xenococcaceae cyanobacterium MO_188.B29]